MSEKEKAGDTFTEKNDEGLPAPGSQGRLLVERKLVRKLDARLIPTIFLIFIMNYIDVSWFSVKVVVSQLQGLMFLL
jgi:hypothetical protein